MKDYKKILEGVVNIINTTEKSDIGFANICTYIGENCPELKESKESEDERMKKIISDILLTDSDEIRKILDANNVLMQDIDTWLEKQGEQKPTKRSREDEVMLNACINVLHRVGHDTLSNWLEKNIKKLQSKSEWSEEDEIKIKSIIVFLKSPALCCMENNKGIIDANIKYLKSFRDRVQPQPKQEWSEEDIATISRVISIVKWAAYSDHSHPILNDKGATELIERLESIKDRYTWKPTEEQIEALWNVYEGGEKQSALVSLYNDLKKL